MMFPQLASGCGTPIPRYESPASRTITCATPSVDATTIGETRFGSKCLHRIRLAGAKRLGGGHEFRVLQRKNLTSDNAAKPEPTGETQKYHERANRQSRPRHQRTDEKQKPGNG